MPVNIPLLIPVVAAAITVFGLILIACCLSSAPAPRKRRAF